MNYFTYLKKMFFDKEFKQEFLLQCWLKEIGINIKDKRKAANLTQIEFAKLLGMKQPMIAKIESGNNMQCSTLFKISSMLNEDINIFGASIKSENAKIKKYII